MFIILDREFSHYQFWKKVYVIKSFIDLTIHNWKICPNSNSNYITLEVLSIFECKERNVGQIHKRSSNHTHRCNIKFFPTKQAHPRPTTSLLSTYFSCFGLKSTYHVGCSLICLKCKITLPHTLLSVILLVS